MTGVLIKKRNLHRETYTEAGGYEETQLQKREAWSRVSPIALRGTNLKTPFRCFLTHSVDSTQQPWPSHTAGSHVPSAASDLERI